MTQTRPKVDPRTVLGAGKLSDLVIRCFQSDIDLVIFDQDLNPAQARNLSERMELRVIDRTQLILDIFAQRATTGDGKLQVELAQLRYRMPRLAQRADLSLSRLAGGIGGRGPGETKLESDRRRVRDRITRLERETKRLTAQREGRRRKRGRRGVPVLSIVGYTNAGKSTLLRALTQSDVHVEDKMFATLDPVSRRLRFPREREVIITDTVGFIRDLPEDLMAAFHATLEELRDASLLLHVVDAASPDLDRRIRAVRDVLGELGLDEKARAAGLQPGRPTAGGRDRRSRAALLGDPRLSARGRGSARAAPSSRGDPLAGRGSSAGRRGPLRRSRRAGRLDPGLPGSRAA